MIKNWRRGWLGFGWCLFFAIWFANMGWNKPGFTTLVGLGWAIWVSRCFFCGKWYCWKIWQNILERCFPVLRISSCWASQLPEKKTLKVWQIEPGSDVQQACSFGCYIHVIFGFQDKLQGFLISHNNRQDLVMAQNGQARRTNTTCKKGCHSVPILMVPKRFGYLIWIPRTLKHIHPWDLDNLVLVLPGKTTGSHLQTAFDLQTFRCLDVSCGLQG